MRSVMRSAAGAVKRIVKVARRTSGVDTVDRYHQNGYAIVPGYCSQGELSALRNLAAGVWSEPRDQDVIIDIGTGRLANTRMRLADAPIECRNENHKINDLYLISKAFRAFFLSKRLCSILGELLDGPPLIINSLNFRVGSEQRAHFDTWYMPPPVEDKMAVVSIALDDYGPDNGPLFYYPGSHMIPKYRFSTGHIRAVESEMPSCDAYLWAEVHAREIERKIFQCKAGDMFIWHSQLLHGGSPVLDRTKTRRSIVVHYWRYGDIEANEEYPWFRNLSLQSDAGYYLNRPHQQVGHVVEPDHDMPAPPTSDRSLASVA
jgi:phytanoyl-CoA hydroxylase